MYEVKIIPVLNDNYIFILRSKINNEAIIVDPSIAEPILDYANNHQLKIKYIINTHHHNDHIGGNNQIKLATNCKIIAPIYDRSRIKADLYVKDSDVISLLDFSCEVIYTPGHTSGHVLYYFAKQNLLFAGDCLFSCGCGRLFEGSAEEMFRSLNKISNLLPNTKIYCAHEYTLKNVEFALSIDDRNLELLSYKKKAQELRSKNLPTIPTDLSTELKINPFLRTDNDFIKQKLNMINANQLDVFKKIRSLRDDF